MSEQYRAVFLDHPSLDLGDLDMSPLREVCDSLTLHEKTAPEQVAERIRDAEIVVTNKVRLEADVLASAPSLKLVLVAATGTNNVDVEKAKSLGITVCNCQGYGTPSVAQHTLMLLLALATRLTDYHDAVRGGRWQKAEQFCFLDFPIMELSGKTLGILGHGELGSAVARLAEAFGMRILVGQLPGRPATEGRMPLEELLPQVDALSLHCPLTEQTRDLIGAPQLAAMKPGAFLINAGRGGLVNEEALVDALRSGHLGGAGIDVLTEEPPRNGNPLLAPDIPNLIITPHSAWGSREARQRIVAQLAENTNAFKAGAPLRTVG